MHSGNPCHAPHIAVIQSVARIQNEAQFSRFPSCREKLFKLPRARPRAYRIRILPCMKLHAIGTSKSCSADLED